MAKLLTLNYCIHKKTTTLFSSQWQNAVHYYSNTQLRTDISKINKHKLY